MKRKDYSGRNFHSGRQEFVQFINTIPLSKRYYLVVMVLLLGLSTTLKAQNQFDIRFQLSLVDCEQQTACFDVQLRSSNGQTWGLAGQNYRIYYDASLASFQSGVSVLPSDYQDFTLIQDIQGANASATNGNLSFEDNLSFLNYAMDLNNTTTGGIDLSGDGTWVTTSQLCFDVDPSLVNDPDICLEAVWARESLTMEYATSFVEVSEWVQANDTEPAVGFFYDDLEGGDGNASCFNLSCAVVPPTQDYDIRLQAGALDCGTRVVCYDVQLRNPSNQPWNLAGQNYRLYYDGSKASWQSGISVLNNMYEDFTLIEDIQDVDASATNSNLSFESTLSFLNYTMDLMDVMNGGVDLPNDGSWFTTSQLCFELEAFVINDPNTCLEAVWARDGLTNAYATSFVEVAEWVGPNDTEMANGLLYDDLDPTDGQGSCFDNVCASSINGLAWKDCNNNGIREPAETFLENVPVTLNDGTTTLNTTTSNDGTYSFTGLNAGTYTLTFGFPAVPTGLDFSPMSQGNDDTINSDVDQISGSVTLSITSGTDLNNIDAGYVDVEAPIFSFSVTDLQNAQSGDTLTYECGTVPTFMDTDASATDNCDSDVFIALALSSFVANDCEIDGYLYQEQYTWSASDDCGNSSNFTIVVRSIDTQNPTIQSAPASEITISCDETEPSEAPVFTDACDVDLEVLAISSISVIDCGEQIQRSWTAMDDCGNGVTFSQIINKIDNEAPVLVGVPADIMGTCGDVPTAANVTATDNCDGNVVVQFNEVNSGTGCNENIVRTWTATDMCGNTTSASQTIVLGDNEAPVLVGVPADIMGTCGDVPTPANVTATDNCDGNVVVQFNEVNSGTGCNENIVRTWTATDMCGNTTSASQTIVLGDNEAPVLVGVPADIMGTCGDVPTPANVTATDNCDGNVVVQFNEVNSGTGCNENIVRTWTATDMCGNTTSASQTIVLGDNEAPVLVGVPADIMGTCGDVPTPANVTATDNCDGNVVVQFNEVNSGTGCNENIVRTWTATDICGNTTSASQTIVLGDNEAPMLVGVPADIMGTCGDVPTAANVTATDNCDGNVVVQFNEVNSGTGCNENIVRTWTATDMCGNTTSASQTIVLGDNEAPVLVGVPANIMGTCGDVPTPANVTATDNCDGNVVVQFNEVNSGTSCNENIVRTWTATDMCGNTTSASQTIVLGDNEAPVLVGVPADIAAMCGTVPPRPTVTATDNCDGNVIVQYNELNNGGTGCNENIVRTWTATDMCGNTTSASQTIVLGDSEAPVLVGVPADIMGTCGDVPTAANVTATDNCDGNVVVQFNEVNSGTSCNENIVRTWTATDMCGNTTSASQTIVLGDNEAPVLVGVPADIAAMCGTVPPRPTVTATDNCDGNVIVQYNELNNGGTGCNENIVRTWTATDMCGNTTSASQTIVVGDNEAPVLVGVPADIMGTCGTVPTPANVTATDNCDNNIVVDFNETGGGIGCNQNITRTWTATDMCGNTTSASQTIVLGDNEAPVLVGVPADIMGACGTVPTPANVTATDNCDGNVVVQFNEVNSGTGCNENIVRTWTATDMCGNTTSASQTIVLGDNEAPVLVGVPADIMGTCGTVPTPANVTATDNCDGNVVVQFNEVNSGTGCNENIVRTWTATDMCGNTTSASQTIVLGDNEAPMLVGVPANIMGTCGGGVPAVATVTATDNCDGNVVVQFNEVNSGTGCNENIVRTWTATDMCGNTVSESQMIVLGDNQGPSITAIDPVLASLNDGDTLMIDCANIPIMNENDVTVTDNCDDQPSINFTETVEIGNCDEDGFIYLLHCCWSAEDNCGNVTELCIYVMVKDTSPPVLTNIPPAVEIECGETASANNLPTATDNCDENVTITYADSDLISGDCPYTIIRTWIATDDCGNTTTATQNILVNDTQAPVLLGVPDDLTADCNALPVLPEVKAIDECSGELPVLFNETSSGSCINGAYTITRTWMATDDCGNTVMDTQIITLIDNEAPVLSGVPADMNFDCPQDLPAPATVTATDNCDDNVSIMFNENISGTGCELTYTRTWTATDDCGNETVRTQTIRVNDNEVPVLSGVPADMNFDCPQDLPAPATVTATDNCDNNVSIMFNENVSGTGCELTYTRTWTATDDCGNETVRTQTIRVNDNEAPIFSNIPTDISVDCDAIPNAENITATDNCTPNVIVSFNETTGTGCPYLITRTWTATDDCGNETVRTQTITVMDTVDPMLFGVPDDISVGCGDIPTPANVTATDNCSSLGGDDNVMVTLNEQTIGDDCNYKILRTWTAEDNCGNTVSAVQTITVTDQADPVLVGVPNDITVDCEDVPAPPDVTGTDDCDDDVTLTYAEIGSNPNGDCTYEIKRIWAAEDNCGNTVVEEQIITVIDNSPPTLTFTNPLLQGLTDGSTLTVNCNEAEVFGENDATGTDLCSEVTIMFMEGIPENGNCAEDGFISIITCTWIAKDACGNQTSVSIHIEIRDEDAPSLLNVPADQTVSQGNVPPPANVTASDDCDSNVEIAFDETQIDNGCGSIITRTWTASDNCGHISVANQTITVEGNIQAEVTAVSAENCEGADGSAILSPETYTYQWSDGGMGANRTDLAAGTYSVTATDNVCQTTLTVTIPAECDCIEPTIVDVMLTNASCAGADGQATVVITENIVDYTFSWTPDVGIANATGDTRTDLPVGDYSVMVRFMGIEDCEKIVTFTIESAPELSANVLSVTAEGCGELGTASIMPTIYTYNWSDGGLGAMRDDLLAGFYTITATDDSGCTQVLEISVPAIDCVDDMDTLQVTIPFETVTEYCIDEEILLIDGEIVSIDYCNSGDETTVQATDVDGACLTLEPADEFFGMEMICVIHCSQTACDTTYLEVTVEEPEGLNGNFISASAATMVTDCAIGEAEYCIELPLAVMDNYKIEINGELFTGQLTGCSYEGTRSYNYLTIPDFGEVGPYKVEWIINEQTYVGSFMVLTELIELMNTWDNSTTWFLDDTEGSITGAHRNTVYGSLIIKQTMTSSTAILELNAATFPNSTMMKLPTGANHVVLTNVATGMSDEINIMVYCVTTDYRANQIMVGQTDTLCLNMDEMIGEEYTIRNLCEEESGEVVLFEMVPGTNCIACSAVEAGRENACFVICDEMGICDTTYLEVDVRSPETIAAPVANVDTIFTTAGTPIIINVLNNDRVVEMDSLLINAQPNLGTVTLNLDNTITYTPANDDCGTQPQVFSYVVCNAAGCDETLVMVYITCDEIEVFSGFSPNGDGINDLFYIGGLSKYPNHTLTVFNRWGSKILSTKNYQNNWNGTFNGQDLPDGTYFYVLDTGEGKVMSGYVQINR